MEAEPAVEWWSGTWLYVNEERWFEAFTFQRNGFSILPCRVVVASGSAMWLM